MNKITLSLSKEKLVEPPYEKWGSRKEDNRFTFTAIDFLTGVYVMVVDEQGTILEVLTDRSEGPFSLSPGDSIRITAKGGESLSAELHV